MIATAFIGSMIFLTSLPIGYLFLKTPSNEGSNRYFILDYILAGISLLMALAALISFVLPIALLPLLLLLAAAIFLWIRHYTALRQLVLSCWASLNGVEWAASLIIIVAMLLLSTTSPSWVDAGLYHAQTIQWIDSFPVVPGLGNLHLRLAFNSHFHLITALFDLSFLNLSHFHGAATAFLVTAFCLHYYFQTTRGNGDNRSRAWYHVFLILLLLAAFQGWYSSPSSDLPAALFALAAVDIALLRKQTNPIYLALIVASAVTIKLTVFPLLVLPIIVVYRQWRTAPLIRSMAIVMGIVALIVFAPFIGRNVVLSGYPLIPSTEFDFFPVQWKVPAKVVADHAEEVKYFARRPLPDWEIAKDAAFRAWLPEWYNQQFRFDKLLLWATIILTPLMVLRWVFGHLDKRNRVILIFSFVSASIIFWLAPATRFFYPFWLPFIAISAAELANATISKLWLIAVARHCVPLLLILLVLYENRNSEISINNQFLFPVPYRNVEVIKSEIDGIPVSIPTDGDKCWNQHIPCLDQAPNSEVRLLGTQLEQGFYVEKANESN